MAWLQHNNSGHYHIAYRPFTNGRRLRSRPDMAGPRRRASCDGVGGRVIQIGLSGDDLSRAVDAHAPRPASRAPLRAECVTVPKPLSASTVPVKPCCLARAIMLGASCHFG